MTDALGDALKTFPDMPQLVPEAVIKKCGKYKKKELEDLIHTISTYYVSASELTKSNSNVVTLFSSYVAGGTSELKRKQSVFSRLTSRRGSLAPNEQTDNRDASPNKSSNTTAAKDTSEEGGDVMDLDDFLNADFNSDASSDSDSSSRSSPKNRKAPVAVNNQSGGGRRNNTTDDSDTGGDNDSNTESNRGGAVNKKKDSSSNDDSSESDTDSD
jgi:hypothetical protein